MKTSPDLPPNYETIAKTFNLTGREVVFTYGPVIYNVHSEVPEHLEVHERVHMRQQYDPEAWWAQYLIDPKFRYEQELEAYRAQYQFIKKQGDRGITFLFLRKLAQDFSSPIYGSIVTFRDALNAISAE